MKGIHMKITFLFGAGAEGKGQIDMPFGNEFKKDIVIADNVVPFMNGINKSASHILPIKAGTNLAHNSSGVLYQTIVERQADDTNCIDKLFSEESEKQTVRAYLDYKAGISIFDKDTKSDLSNDFAALYKNNFYECIKKGVSTPQIEYFLKHAGIYAYLDGLFGYLRKPEKYPKECARVVKLYYSALYSVLKSIGKRNNPAATNDDICSCLLSMDRETLSNFIAEQQTAIVEDIRKTKIKTYYGCIYDLKIQCKEKNQKIDISVVNLNYTIFAEQIIGVNLENIAYLHGKLGLFEELKSKRIAPLLELDPTETVFPYLLVQSGVKPIIAPYQIEEFGKATNWMSTSDLVVVLGYGVNSDDEHISNLLRWRIAQNKNVVCFIYAQDKTKFENEQRRIQTQLGISPYLEFKNTSDFESYIEQISTGGQI